MAPSSRRVLNAAAAAFTMLVLTIDSAAAQLPPQPRPQLTKRPPNDSAARAVQAARVAAQPPVTTRVRLVPSIVGLRIDSARRVVSNGLDTQLRVVNSKVTRDQGQDSVVADQSPLPAMPYDRRQPMTVIVWVYAPDPNAPNDATGPPPPGGDSTPRKPVRGDSSARKDQRVDSTSTKPARPDSSKKQGPRVDSTNTTPERAASLLEKDRRGDSTNSTATGPGRIQVTPPRVDSVEVPDIAELTAATAEERIRARALRVGAVGPGPLRVLSMLSRVTTQAPRAGTRVPPGAPVSFVLGIPTGILAVLGVIAALVAGVLVYAIRRPAPPGPPTKGPAGMPASPIVPTIALGLPTPTRAPSVSTPTGEPLITQTIDVSIVAPPPSGTVHVEAELAPGTTFVTIGDAP